MALSSTMARLVMCAILVSSFAAAALPPAIKQYVTALSSETTAPNCSLLRTALSSTSFSYTSGMGAALNKEGFLDLCSSLKISASHYNVTFASSLVPSLGTAIKFDWSMKDGGHTAICSGIHYFQLDGSGLISDLQDYSDAFQKGASCSSRSTLPVPSAVNRFYDVYNAGVGHKLNCTKLESILAPNFRWVGLIETHKFTIGKTAFIAGMCHALNTFTGNPGWFDLLPFTISTNGTTLTSTLWEMEYLSYLPWKRGNQTCRGMSVFEVNSKNQLAVANCWYNSAEPGCEMLSPH